MIVLAAELIRTSGVNLELADCHAFDRGLKRQLYDEVSGRWNIRGTL